MFGADPVDRILELLGDLAGEDRRDWPGPARSERVVGLARVVERAQAALVGATAEWDGQLDWTTDGACSPATWLARHTPVAQGRADRLVRCARLVRRHDRTAKALGAGDLSSLHLEVLADKTRRREDLYADHEDTLLDAAATLDVDDFAKVAETWRLHADATRADAEAFHSVEHSSIHLSSTFNGRMALSGDLDAEGGAIVLAALDARVRPDPGGTDLAPRTLSERRAAALVEMAAESLRRGSPGGRAPIGVDVIIDVDTLHAHPAADLTTIRCALGTGTPITTATALRLCCDAAVGRVLMHGPSEILDLGRRTRIVSAAQRRALIHRDRGCVFPGCDRPHDWCDAHHLHHWTRGGPTNLDNLALLCRRHHVAVHEGTWKLTRNETTGDWSVERPP